jgi:glutamyl-tRNA(Gln) amidotransferase subunit E
LKPEHIIESFELLASGKIPKEELEIMMEEMMKGEDPLTKLRKRGSPSEDELNVILDKIIQNNMELVKKRGERAVVTLMGIAMKEMRGKFSGKRVNDLLRKKILEF